MRHGNHSPRHEKIRIPIRQKDLARRGAVRTRQCDEGSRLLAVPRHGVRLAGAGIGCDPPEHIREPQTVDGTIHGNCLSPPELGVGPWRGPPAQR